MAKRSNVNILISLRIGLSDIGRNVRTYIKHVCITN